MRASEIFLALALRIYLKRILSRYGLPNSLLALTHKLSHISSIPEMPDSINCSSKCALETAGMRPYLNPIFESHADNPKLKTSETVPGFELNSSVKQLSEVGARKSENQLSRFHSGSENWDFKVLQPRINLSFRLYKVECRLTRKPDMIIWYEKIEGIPGTKWVGLIIGLHQVNMIFF